MVRIAALAIATLAGASAVLAGPGGSLHRPTKHSKAAAAVAAAADGSGSGSGAGAAVSDAAPTAFVYGKVSSTYPGVRSTNKNGPTNPKSPSLGTPINQQSDSRLASINSIDDWCTFGPGSTGQPIGDIEAETVAWCTKARNNARVIPDGTLTAVHFVKTPLYLQVMALGDFTKIGLVAGDEGGELDPHGATNMGNPVGGNVTSNVTGTDVFYEEWMNYISYNQMCFRVCIAAGSQISTGDECEHQLDVMGCNFVMPGDYTDNVFESCDGDAAYPPGRYPLPGGGFSTFRQYFTGSYTGPDGQVTDYQNGSPDQVTPTAAYSLPATSNCVPTQSIANGIASLASSASAAAASASSTAAPAASGSSANTRPHSSSSRSSSGSSNTTGAGVRGTAVSGSGAALLVSFGCAAAALLAGAALA